MDRFIDIYILRTLAEGWGGNIHSDCALDSASLRRLERRLLNIQKVF